MSQFRRSVADVVSPLLRAALGDAAPVHLRGWDRSETGPPDAPVRLVLAERRALRRILWAPNELGFARAYVAGEVQIEGDLLKALDALDDVANGPGVAVDARTVRAAAVAAVRLGAIGPRPAPPAEEAALRGGRHSRRRDAAAISHHYDVGNDFYRLVLGDSMTYSCAYWEHDPGPGFTLEDAQLAKCDLVARKLGLHEGMRVLDVGCGWGTFAIRAADRCGVRVVGVTLSREQADFAQERAKAAGVADLVEIRVQDYRDVRDGPYDAISSIGMAEHVGLDNLPVYAADLFALLAPGGRLLNHAISRRPGPRSVYSKTSFIDRYVFPDGELETMGTMVSALEDAGFEVRDVESLREHYGLTLRNWVEHLEQNWDAAVVLAGANRARIWRLYMAGSALAFEAGRIGVNQVLAVRPGAHGDSGLPRTRHAMLS